MIKVIGVRFRKAGKVYYFDPLDFDIKQGSNVIVETAEAWNTDLLYWRQRKWKTIR